MVRQYPPVTIETADPPPICLLCGVRIFGPDAPGITDSLHPGVVFREERWKMYKNTKMEHVVVPSHEVEQAHFPKFPRLWAGAFRGLIKNKTKYTLTGISIIRPSICIGHHLPRDSHTARIGGRRGRPQYDDESFIHFHTAHISRQPKKLRDRQIGYLIHAHCWILLAHAFNCRPSALESRSVQLVTAARKYWRNHPAAWAMEDEALYTHTPARRLYSRPSRRLHGCDIYQNPLVVPEVANIIACGEKKKEKKKRKDDDPYIGPSLPLEVAILIAEQICPVEYTAEEVTSLRAMLDAFQWVLPEWFWEQRCSHDLFFEMKADSQFHWETRLDLMHLYASSDCLANRERVLSVMKGIKQLLRN
ncbi:hypothetical protein ASPZODRAFT_18661 [Penicilliopsis zonata CBS 506.65]|uniref:Uncharacterized protein n=1 Tax=Penicilliopsis zonata CBS 506.65 TaxID=1073090 RepID=A0A1L9SBA9_9EURO|nr:hypothetical protein ASPZODRAFT_18661 [Penicilliopsis zonata CBS 506.65]OJJ44470.1 hypothetical protein ASPZODRAFT_18661 [Penicilliopsis zonata CBS 506.65]